MLADTLRIASSLVNILMKSPRPDDSLLFHSYVLWLASILTRQDPVDTSPGSEETRI